MDEVTPAPRAVPGAAGSGAPAEAGAVRYAALGDSITAGLGDGVSMGARRPPTPPRGFARMLAASLGPAGQVGYVNLAATGATAADVRASQLPAAVAWGPTLASLIVGLNDVLDPRFDPGRTGDHLAHCVAGLRGAGAVVMMVRFADPAPLLRMPGGLRRILSRRVELLNGCVDQAAAADPGVVVLDLATWPELRERCCWDVDRIHPGSRGHALLARRFAELLVSSGARVGDPPDVAHPPRWAPVPIVLPSVPPPTGGPGAVRHAWWLARVGVPWLATRRGSVVPGLAVTARAGFGALAAAARAGGRRARAGGVVA